MKIMDAATMGVGFTLGTMAVSIPLAVAVYLIRPATWAQRVGTPQQPTRKPLYSFRRGL